MSHRPSGERLGRSWNRTRRSQLDEAGRVDRSLCLRGKHPHRASPSSPRTRPPSRKRRRCEAAASSAAWRPHLAPLQHVSQSLPTRGCIRARGRFAAGDLSSSPSARRMSPMHCTERVVSDGAVVPHLGRELSFRHQSSATRRQVLEGCEDLRSEVNGPASVQETSTRPIDHEVVEEADLAVVDVDTPNDFRQFSAVVQSAFVTGSRPRRLSPLSCAARDVTAAPSLSRAELYAALVASAALATTFAARPRDRAPSWDEL